MKFDLLFDSLIINNFKQFKGKHVFKFSGGVPGLHFIEGENNADPALEANGAGKTNLWNALFWILYGKDVRGLRAGDICTWGLKGGTVGTLAFRRSGTPYRLRRTWKPNTLTLITMPHGENREKISNTVTQKDIDTLIGLDVNSFKHAILIGQFEPMFFDLDPIAKAALISEAWGFDVWVEYSDTASKKYKAQGIAIEDSNDNLIKVSGEIKALRDQRKLQREEAEAFAQVQTLTIKGIKKGLAKLKSAYLDINKILEADKKLLTEIETPEIDNQALKSMADLHSILGLALNETKTEQRVIESTIIQLRREINRFKDVENTCPYCLQEVSPKHIERSLRILTKRIKKQDKKWAILEDTKTQTIAEMDGYSKTITKMTKEMKDAAQRISSVDSRVNNHNLKLELNLDKQKDYKKDIKKEGSKENPFSSLGKQTSKVIFNLKKQRVGIKEDLASQERQAAAMEFWIKGFKEIRLKLIEKALTSLEIEVNNCLIQLGLENWSISFDIERQTKTAGISKGFTVLIKSPHNKELVPWKSWSGGETQRLGLAGVLGLSNLIQSSKGIQSNILIFDEPTQHIGTQGINDLLDLLYETARTEQKQIWLIDHRTLDYGGFASKVKIVRDAKGCSHIYE